MKILGIESSGMVASVAVSEQNILVGEYSVNFKKTHSQTLLPMIDTLASMIELDLHTIDAIAISKGPGSFTGLRIGSATAKGLGLALNKPIVPVPTIDALAYNLYAVHTDICPIVDARRGQVYTGIYGFCEDGSFVIKKEQMAVSLRDLLDELNQTQKKVIFVGDATLTLKDTIEEYCKVPYSFAPLHLNQQRAAAVCALGVKYFEEGRIETAEEHRPDYLRLSQAERERIEKEKRI